MNPADVVALIMAMVHSHASSHDIPLAVKSSMKDMANSISANMQSMAY